MKTLVLLSPPVPPNHLGGDGKFALDIARVLSKRDLNLILFTLLYNEKMDPYTINGKLLIVPIPIIDGKAQDRWDVPIWDPSFTSERDQIILQYLSRYGVLNNRHWIHEIGGALYNGVLSHLHHTYNLDYSCHIQFVLRHYFRHFPEDGPLVQYILNSQDDLVASASSCMFLSSFDRDAFAGVETYKTIIPNGTLLRKAPMVKSHTRDTLNIYYGGRLHNPMKGAQIMLPILSEVMKNNHNVILHVSAPDTRHLDLLDDSVSDRLLYHGWLSNRQNLAIIDSCDLTLMPSVYEPFGLLAIESLSRNVPVFASRVGGLSDIVIQGKNGCFLDLDRPSSIIGLLGRIAQGKNLLAALAPEPDYMLERYDIEHIADLYMQALSEHLH